MVVNLYVSITMATRCTMAGTANANANRMSPCTQVPPSTELYTVAPLDSASILLVVEGDATATSAAALSDVTLRRGTVLFVSANESVSLQVSSQAGMTMFRACCLL